MGTRPRRVRDTGGERGGIRRLPAFEPERINSVSRSRYDVLMPRARPVALLLLVGAIGVTMRADATEYVIGASEDLDGPPYALLDLSDLDPIALDGEEERALALPFEFLWHGERWSEARAGADGVLLFGADGDPTAPSCPGEGGSWSGIAPLWSDLGAGELRTATFGRYPYRAYAVEWRAPDAVAGGEAQVQVWLLESFWPCCFFIL